MNDIVDNENSFLREQTLLVSRQAIFLLCGLFIETIIKYGYNILLGHTLGAEILGRYFLGLTVVTFIATLGCFGVDGGIIRYVSQYLGRNETNKAKAIFYNGLKFAVSVGIGLAILFFTLDKIGFLSRLPVLKEIRVFYGAIPFLIVFSVIISLFQGYKKIQYQVYTQSLIRPLLNLIIFLFLLRMGCQLSAAIWSFVMAVILADFAALFFLKRGFGIFSGEADWGYDRKGFMHQSFWIWVILIANLMMRWSDTVALSIFRNYHEVGIYGVAVRVSAVFELFFTPIALIFGPVVSHLYDQGKNDEIEKLLKTVSRWLFSIILPLFALIAFNARAIMGVFGPEFKDGSSILIILSCIFLLTSFTGAFNVSLLTMTGKVRLFSFNILFFAALNIILNLIFVPAYGMFAAASISLACFLLLSLLTILQVHRLYRIHPYSLDLLRPLLALAASGAAVYLIAGIPAVNAAVKSVIFIALYFITLGCRPEDKLVFNMVKERLLKNK
ncbi:MAG: oligosaccharide flippase family protein [Candidatus Omnitrophota bacterium]